MASYRIDWRPSARRGFAKLPPLIKQRVARATDALAQEPRPPGALLLSGRTSPTWRIRVGDYRVLYEILGDELIVLVIAVGHRRYVYRGRQVSEPGAPYEAPTAAQAHGGRSWSREVLHHLH